MWERCLIARLTTPQSLIGRARDFNYGSRPADMWAAGTLLDAADEIPARALDTSGKATASEIATAVAASIAVQNEKFAEAKEIAQSDVAAIQTHIELLRKQYPSWVK